MKLKRVTAIPGEQSLEALLVFVTDAEAVKKRVAELKAATKEVNDASERYGKIKDADKHLTEAKNAEAQAKQDADGVREAAKAEVAAEKESLKVARERALEREKKCDAREEQIASALKEAQAEIDSGKADLEKRSDSLDAREAAIARVAEEANRLRDEYMELANRARAALGQPPIDPEESPSAPTPQ